MASRKLEAVIPPELVAVRVESEADPSCTPCRCCKTASSTSTSCARSKTTRGSWCNYGWRSTSPASSWRSQFQRTGQKARASGRSPLQGYISDIERLLRCRRCGPQGGAEVCPPCRRRHRSVAHSSGALLDQALARASRSHVGKLCSRHPASDTLKARNAVGTLGTIHVLKCTLHVTHEALMSETTFTFRVDDALKEQFTMAAKSRDRSGAQLLRDFYATSYDKRKRERRTTPGSDAKCKSGSTPPRPVAWCQPMKSRRNLRHAGPKLAASATLDREVVLGRRKPWMIVERSMST